MTVQMSARLWRWPLFLASVLVSMLCVWLFKDQSMHIPVADGPRYTRQSSWPGCPCSDPSC